jgi:uridylate kinase
LLREVLSQIPSFISSGGQLGIVLGGGNLLRGATLSASGIDRITADQMGMLATIMNGLACRDVLLQLGVPAVVYAATGIQGVAPAYSRDDVLADLEAGRVAILAGGTGNPLFTTDTAACLRAVEIRADAVLKATKVDGIYSADPKKHAGAVRYPELDYARVLREELGVMDLPAICLCRDHGLPIVVFDMHEPDALRRLACGESIGTIVRAPRTAGATPGQLHAQ